MVERLFLAVPRGCMRFVIVVFPDHTHLLFLKRIYFLISARQGFLKRINKGSVGRFFSNKDKFGFSRTKVGSFKARNK